MMLNIKDGLNLYKMLAPYVPEYETGSDILEFIGKIIESMNSSSEPWIFADVLILMTGKTLDELKNNSPTKNVDLFIKEFIAQDFLSLRTFCKDLGFNG